MKIKFKDQKWHLEACEKWGITPCLTAGKEYEVREAKDVGFILADEGGYITDDAGDELLVVYSGCSFIGEHSWTIICDNNDSEER